MCIRDSATGKCLGFPIVGTSEDLERLNDGKTDFVIAVGNNAIRRRIAESHDVNWVKLIHPSAQIALGVQISKGTVVMAGAIVNAEVTIGEHCIVNSCLLYTSMRIIITGTMQRATERSSWTSGIR